MFYSMRKFAFGLLCFMAILALISVFLDESIATRIQVSSYVSAFWLILLITTSKVLEIFVKPFNHHESKGE